MSISAGCVAAQRGADSDIRKVMSAQQSAWNAGDVDGFMDGYWRCDELTFSSGGTTTRGWRATLERYRKRYDSPEKMGQLTFSEIEIRPLAEGSFFGGGRDNGPQLVLGAWRLDRGNESVAGRFTLIFRRIADRWVIVHDHTSVQAAGDSQ